MICTWYEGSMNEPSEEVPVRQFDSLPSRNASGSSMSSDKDQINKEHMTKVSKPLKTYY